MRKTLYSALILTVAAFAAVGARADDYINIKKAGVGPSLDLVDSPNNYGLAGTNLGTVDLRYWANDKFGVDLGAGFGLPQVSPNSEFVGVFRAEGMFAMKETRHDVFYLDGEFMPGFGSGSGAGYSPFFMSLQGGFGIEHALAEMPDLAVYAEWNPLSFNIYSPGGGASSETGLGFMGSVMNFTTGFRYYFKP